MIEFLTTMVETNRSQPSLSIAERIGPKEVLRIAWKSTPFPWNLTVPIYGRRVLWELLREDYTIKDYWSSHLEKYREVSPWYRRARPRYSVVSKELRAKGIE